MQDWQILKLLFNNQPSPDEGKQELAKTKKLQNNANYITHLQPAKHHPKLEIQGQCHRHTPTTPKKAQPAQPGTQPIHKQKYIGTLSSSQTTHAQSQTTRCKTQQLQKATLSTLHTPQPQSQNPADCDAYFLMSANDRFPDRHLTSNSLSEPVRRGVVGLADSHKVTHTHTPTQIPSTTGIFRAC